MLVWNDHARAIPCGKHSSFNQLEPGFENTCKNPKFLNNQIKRKHAFHLQKKYNRNNSNKSCAQFGELRSSNITLQAKKKTRPSTCSSFCPITRTHTQTRLFAPLKPDHPFLPRTYLLISSPIYACDKESTQPSAALQAEIKSEQITNLARQTVRERAGLDAHIYRELKRREKWPYPDVGVARERVQIQIPCQASLA